MLALPGSAAANGILLKLTSAINTHQTPMTRAALHRLMRTGDVAIGWVARTAEHTADTTSTSTTTGLDVRFR